MSPYLVFAAGVCQGIAAAVTGGWLARRRWVELPNQPARPNRHAAAARWN